MRKFVKVEIIYGSPNSCIAMNGTRITLAKLWGFGRTTREFKVSKEKIKRLIEGKEWVTFHLLNYGRDGVFLEGERITNNGSKKEYNQYLEIKKEQLRLMNKCWSRKRARAYFDGSIWDVRTIDIKDVLKYI